MEITQAIEGQLRAALWECTPPAFATHITEGPIIHEVLRLLEADVNAYVAKDPACGGQPATIVSSYTSFKALPHYRLAHAIDSALPLGNSAEAAAYAFLITSRGKLLSGADIHHRCKIGRRFVLDHGMGTVIGETSQIGDDCYVLGGVTLGATGIANNPSGKRHPTLGHRVQVGAGARIFGAIRIGNDVFIGPDCTVTHDLAPGSRVLVRQRMQVIRDGQRQHAELA